jgi:HPt (histidine-containing phosphotransfer) domain-containing protein
MWHLGCSKSRRAEEMKKFIAQVDPDLCDLIPGFLEHKRGDTRKILSGICSEHIDFEELCKIGHQLKGEGGSYGLDAISLYGAEIEQAARNHDTEAIRHCANDLAAYLDCVQIQYE